ncbi:uncharacterized protein LOC129017160 [Pongo pygmaeus]|uniref:uncharacterized protein LOC129017160 n=1 Tax=Pongo pygmaeus TaxID=9600 RepID=UPI0023E16F03|nr:uncharacterized protein LOC129017160 [Pongo pygmaeus]
MDTIDGSGWPSGVAVAIMSVALGPHGQCCQEQQQEQQWRWNVSGCQDLKWANQDGETTGRVRGSRAASHPQAFPDGVRDQDDHTPAKDKSPTGAHSPAGEEQTHVQEDGCIFSPLFSEK